MTTLTEHPPKVDGSGLPADPAPFAPFMTVSEIAERDGVSKQAVSKRVRAMVEMHGLEVELDGQGRVARINVAQYDHLRDRHGDPSKDQRPETPEPAAPAADSYEEALRLKTHYEAVRRGLELDEHIGKLVRVDELVKVGDEIGAKVAQVIGSLDNEAEAFAMALDRDGAHGLRVLLKQTRYRMLTEVADALSALAKLAAQKARASAED
ncbi:MULTISPECIES: winged helix-turn-helix domain-containing protein [unclassified Bradyrhizobium]|uniref:winged helix-turn-helix domain-containing protein n=1 Tax=unclassified Bradyrhizobium TaxID=2631580 RepID=UPI00291680F0|nr:MULTISPECIES: winged helix-turn-helix domain-containing protein [unclassified Bradyrhizobium]